MFDQLEMAPPDPILGLTEAFKADPSPNKINLGVGIYKNESGKTPIFSAVKKAERKILEQEDSKSYLPIPGSDEYAAAVQELLFGPDHEIVSSKRAVTAHAPGGTGALRVAGDFLKKFRPGAKIWVSDPTWSNHLGIYEAAGFEIEKYPYCDDATKGIDIDAMLKAVESMPEGDIVLLHGCCHNPTGMDPSRDQWNQIAEAVARRSVLPIIDLAYQGFGKGLAEDAESLRLLCAASKEAMVASSFSKNFGLYNERVGALTAVCDSADTAEKVISHIKIAIRRNYSNPPSHGGAIITTVLSDPALRDEWEQELAVIRDRIRAMRTLFVDTLKAKGVTRDFSHVLAQNGMFSYSGLSEKQVAALRDQYSVYMVKSGRMNVAGMTPGNMDTLCQAIAAIL